MSLTDDRIARWSRQLLVPGFGEAAMEHLLEARVRAIGLEGVATAGLVYLVQGGVGRIWLDDPEDVSPADLVGWLYAPSAVGTSRVAAAQAALARLSSFVGVEPYPIGGVPTAALIAAPSAVQALESAEAARRAVIPHVVVQTDGDGGTVVSIPPGAPCFSCARNLADAGRPAAAGAAALHALGAQELLQLITAPTGGEGRRIEIVRGVCTVRPTIRLPGCVCGGEPLAAES